MGEVLLLQEALEPGERISNIVLMGMGEPLLNFPEVERAIRILCDEFGANISPRRITLSTAGHVPGIRKLAASDLGVNLAVSLSATTDEVRDPDHAHQPALAPRGPAGRPAGPIRCRTGGGSRSST